MVDQTLKNTEITVEIVLFIIFTLLTLINIIMQNHIVHTDDT